MPWYIAERRNLPGQKPRAIAWGCSTSSRIRVEHCGHPTALRPYSIRLNGENLYAELGAFRLLREAQAKAEWLIEQGR